MKFLISTVDIYKVLVMCVIMTDGLSCGFQKRLAMQGTVCNALGAAMVIFLWWMVGGGVEDETVDRVGEGWHVERRGEYFVILSLCI